MLDKDGEPWKKNKKKNQPAAKFKTAHDLSIKDFIYASVNIHAPFSDLPSSLFSQSSGRPEERWLRTPGFFCLSFFLVVVVAAAIKRR